MEELIEIADEEEFTRRLARHFGIVRGDSRYQKAIATWRELRGGKP